MEYITRTVRSRPGLSQEEALSSLQSHPLFKAGTRIAAIRRRSDRWVADILEPKTAGPPFGDEDGDEAAGPPKPPSGEGPPSDDAPDDGGSEGGPDGPPSGEGGEKKHEKGGEKAEIGQLLQAVQAIADALGVSIGPDPGMGGPDDLGPGAPGPEGPPPGPPGGPADGPGGGSAGRDPGHLPTKLGPGEVLPHQTPMGAPAFASTHNANGVQVPVPGAGGGAMGAPAAATCPHGGDPASCPMCNAAGAQGAPGADAYTAAVQSGRVNSFTASQPDPARKITVKQAKASLEAEFGPQGYIVKQIKRDGAAIRALMARR